MSKQVKYLSITTLQMVDYDKRNGGFKNRTLQRVAFELGCDTTMARIWLLSDNVILKAMI